MAQPPYLNLLHPDVLAMMPAATPPPATPLAHAEAWDALAAGAGGAGADALGGGGGGGGKGGGAGASSTEIRLPQSEMLRPHGREWYGGTGSSGLPGLRSGEMGGRVGLLPSLRSSQMDRYDPPAPDTKPTRAPREDLSGYTAEQKVQRRKDRARYYSSIARERLEQQHKELQKEVDEMSLFRNIVEESPNLVVVLSADINCFVLYCNKASTRLLYRKPNSLLGISLWAIVHPEDREQMLPVFSSTILTLQAPTHHMACRILDYTYQYKDVDLALVYGTQGLICTLWPLLPRDPR